ncbi:flavanone 3-hydroxylase [Tanacetum coccineum]
MNGATPGGLEVPRSLAVKDMLEKAKALPKEHQPLITTVADLKWRYMWRIGPHPSTTRFKDLNSEHIIPEGFPEWEETMDSWGYKLMSAVEAVAEMAAIGFGLPKDAFNGLLKNGPHLLSPTGEVNCLYIWLRNGKKVEVKVLEGCLLIQSRKQLEWVTAGDCMAGLQEVIVTKKIVDVIKSSSEANRSLWRLFSAVASDAIMKPLAHYAHSPLADNYPPVYTGEYFQKELAVIKLNENVKEH